MTSDRPAVGERPPPRPWRRSAKVLVVAADARWALLRMRDPAEPATGTW